MPFHQKKTWLFPESIIDSYKFNSKLSSNNILSKEHLHQKNPKHLFEKTPYAFTAAPCWHPPLAFVSLWGGRRLASLSPPGDAAAAQRHAGATAGAAAAATGHGLGDAPCRSRGRGNEGGHFFFAEWTICRGRYFFVCCCCCCYLGRGKEIDDLFVFQIWWCLFLGHFWRRSFCISTKECWNGQSFHHLFSRFCPSGTWIRWKPWQTRFRLWKYSNCCQVPCYFL